MRLLFLGDLVGRSGRTAVWNRLPGLIRDYKLDFVIVNGENAAGGFGITEDIFLETLNAGADVVTTGNHVWDQREALVYADRHDRFLRPANYPAGTPGRGSNLYIARNGARVLVANIMGRVFMHPDLDDPFAAGEAILAACPLGEVADAVVFDFHAEATSEKLCFGHFVDGRASFVVGPTRMCPPPTHRS
jgi:metallophosphoesterase (TIGR00282 family)